MAQNLAELPNRGKTYLGSSPDRTISSSMQAGIEGSIKDFDDVDPTATSGARMKRSNKRVICMLVRNASTVALLPKQVVTWKSGQRNRQVDGYSDSTNEECAGVVDEFLPDSGVAVNDLFWITVKGHTLVLNAPSAQTVALGDLLGALTSAVSTAGTTTAGRVTSVALTATSTATTNGDAFRASNYHFGVAMSTTATTSANILADTWFMKS